MTHRIVLALLLAATIAGCTKHSVNAVDSGTQSKQVDKKMSDPKTECEAVMNAILPFAIDMLTKHREFFPFGGTMSSIGEIETTMGWTENDKPASTDEIELIERGFREGAASGEYNATALVYDIRTIPPGKQEKQDAIAVALDHRGNYSVIAIFPYSFNSSDQLEIEEPFATKGENKIFDH